MNFTDAEKYCQLVKNCLDQEWLNEKRSRMTQFGKKNPKKKNKQNHHPLALLIHNTERTIDLEKSVEHSYSIIFSCESEIRKKLVNKINAIAIIITGFNF